MSVARDARNLRLIREAIQNSRTRATLATVCRDSGLSLGVVQKMVRQHHLNIAWRARETTEKLSNEYVDAFLNFQKFCEAKAMNYRGAVISALAAFEKKHA